MGLKITESAILLPENIISNQDLEARFGLESGFIESRTGIRERRKFSEDYLTEQVYYDLLNLVIHGRGIPQFDSVTLCTDIFERQSDLNMTRLSELGINPTSYAANCAGSLGAIIQASESVNSGNISNALILAVSRMSDLINPKDTGCSVLWGDGAAAIILERTQGSSGILSYVQKFDESTNLLKIVRDGDSRYCQMDGKKVFSYVLQNVPSLVTECLDAADMSISDVDQVIFHQANGRMLSGLMSRIGITSDKVMINIDRFGNTGAASSLIAFHQLREAGKVRPGQHYLFVTYGLGEQGRGMQTNVALYKE